jgi:hypothetical protein
MRIREALKILEAASVECERHGIDTPDVRAALERRTGKPAGALGLNHRQSGFKSSPGSDK